jgi:NTE family protein
VLVGTSAGSLNVALIASLAHRPPDQAADELVDRWQKADRATVLGPVLVAGVRAAASYAAELLHLPRARLWNVLDNTPLRHTAADREWIDWEQLHTNIDDGLVAAVGVVATRASDGRSVVFVDAGKDVPIPAYDAVRGIEYRRTRLHAHHVLASCALPGLFPAERIVEPGGDDWYVDGGTRLNTPIKPAVMLGAHQLWVVATESRFRRHGHGGARPEVTDSLDRLLHTVLADRMIEDLATVHHVNQLVAAAGVTTARAGTGPDARDYHVVPFWFLGPTEDNTIPYAAAHVFAEQYGTLIEQICRPDIPLLSRILAGRGRSHDDILSYLFFENAFLRELVRLGSDDARERLATGGWEDIVQP